MSEILKKIEDHNKIVETWTPKVRTKIKSNVLRSMKDGKTKPFILRGKNKEQKELKLANSITSKHRKESGEIDRVTFNFEKHGVFVQKGVGKGNRTPKDWFNNILESEIPELADKIAELNADAFIKMAKIK